MGAAAFVYTVMDRNAQPVSGGQANFYVKDTTTRQSVFADVGMQTPATNPVIADSAGRVLVYLNDAQNYSVDVKSADGSETILQAEYTSGDAEPFVVTYAIPNAAGGFSEAQLAAINTVAGDLGLGSASLILTVNNNIANVNLAGENIVDVNKVAAIDEDVSAVADIDAQVVVVSQMRQPIENISDNLDDILSASANLAQREVWIESLGATPVENGQAVTGSTPDSAAAIEAALETGLTVRAGAGQFRVSRTINVLQEDTFKDAFIVGSGEEVTTFVFDNSADDGFVFETVGVNVIERDRVSHGIQACSIETISQGGKAVYLKGDVAGAGAGNGAVRIAKNLNISGHSGGSSFDEGVRVENCTFPKVAEVEYNGTGAYGNGVAITVRGDVAGVDHRYDNITARNCEALIDVEGFGEGIYLLNPIGIGVRRGGQAVGRLSVTERSQPLFHVIGGHIASRDFGWRTVDFTHTCYPGCTMLAGGDYWTGVEIIHTNQDQPHVHDVSGIKMNGNKSAYTGTKALNLVGVNGLSCGSGNWADFATGAAWNEACSDLRFGSGLCMFQVDNHYVGPHTQASWHHDDIVADSYKSRAGRLETLHFSGIVAITQTGGQTFFVTYPIKMSQSLALDYKIITDQTGGVTVNEINTSQASETYAGVNINIDSDTLGDVRFDMQVRLISPSLDPFHPAVLYDASLAGAEYDYQDLTSMRVNRDGTGGYPVVGGPVGVVLDKYAMQGNSAEAYLHGAGLLGLPLTASGNHMIAANDAARPILRQAADGRYSLEGDGTDTSMSAALSGPSNVTYVTVLKTADAAAMLIQDDASSTRYAGAWHDTNASTDVNRDAGSPTIRVNGVAFTGTTRDDLSGLIVDQGICVVSITNLTLDQWTSINEFYFTAGGDTSPFLTRKFAGDRYASWLRSNVSASDLDSIEAHFANKFNVTLA